MTDKILHFTACLIPSCFGLHGACFAAGLGIGKEFGDSCATGNRWSWGDILADGLGIIIGLSINYLIKLL